MHYSKEEKAMWLEDWQKSGKNVWAYANENGLVPQTFARWTKKRTKTDFVEVKLKSRSSLQISGILIEKGDIKIHLPTGITVNELSSVIECFKVFL